MNQLSELAMGSRLKRLSDLFMKDVQNIYKDFGVNFNPKWFPCFCYIAENGKVNVMDIAKGLSVSHPAVSTYIKEMFKNGLVEKDDNENDARSKTIQLTQKGKELLPQLQPLWKALSEVNVELLNSCQNNLLFAIEETERLLNELPFYDRVTQKLKENQLQEVEITDYDKSKAEDFKRLNYQWIEKYFSIEDVDKKVLNEPDKYILKEGGAILFACFDKKVVGTCALIKKEDNIYELSKMAVDENYRGLQIGKKLGLAIIKRAKEMGAHQIELYSNTQLVPAINLYLHLGFKKIDLKVYEYQRSNIKMILNL